MDAAALFLVLLSLMVVVAVVFLAVCCPVARGQSYYYSWLLGRGKARLLPPGSMGWPLVGETLKLFNQSPTTFFSDRQNRYGSIFKTHILGCPCIMVSEPETIKLVLVKKAHLFKPTFPPSKERMIGPGALNFHHGTHHDRLKKLVQATFSPSSTRRAVPEIEKVALALLPDWEEKSAINTHVEMKKYAFDVAMLAAFGCEVDAGDSVKKLYHCIHEGYNSMPFDIPGFSYSKAVKARKLLGDILENIIETRRRRGGGGNRAGGGLLGAVLESRDEFIQQLTVSQIADNMFGVIFAAQDTTASVLTWIFKFLNDNKPLLRSIEEEHAAILQRRNKEGRGLSWDDTKRMPLTVRVIQETLRAASVLGFTYREAMEDVQLQGFLIPRGWKVLPLFVSVHHSANFFPKPHQFDPSRFEVPPKPNTFMPFGIGIHSCPGNELAKLEMLVLLHHLVTNLRWDVVSKEDGVEYSPFPIPRHGLPINVFKREE